MLYQKNLSILSEGSVPVTFVSGSTGGLAGYQLLRDIGNTSESSTPSMSSM